MANVTPNNGGTPPTSPKPQPSSVVPLVSTNPLHNGFLLLLGQIIGVLIASVVADSDDRIGIVLVVIFVGLWILLLVNRTSVFTDWGTKLGL